MVTAWRDTINALVVVATGATFLIFATQLELVRKTPQGARQVLELSPKSLLPPAQARKHLLHARVVGALALLLLDHATVKIIHSRTRCPRCRQRSTRRLTLPLIYLGHLLLMCCHSLPESCCDICADLEAALGGLLACTSLDEHLFLEGAQAAVQLGSTRCGLRPGPGSTAAATRPWQRSAAEHTLQLGSADSTLERRQEGIILYPRRCTCAPGRRGRRSHLEPVERGAMCSWSSYSYSV